MPNGLTVDLARIEILIIAALLLFYVILPLWAAREGIAWGMKRGTIAIISAAVVHQVALNKGIQAPAAFIMALVAGYVAAQLVPARSRYIPTRIKRKLKADYELRTGKKYSGRQVEMDHIWPFARGGSHTYDNLRVVDKAKNRRKGARKPTPKDWL